MDGPRDCHTGWNESGTEIQVYLISLIYWILKKDRNKLFYKTEVEWQV